MQVNLERISFITPFSDSEDQTQPKLNFECVNFPSVFDKFPGGNGRFEAKYSLSTRTVCYTSSFIY
jgi:hypothetical protein